MAHRKANHGGGGRGGQSEYSQGLNYGGESLTSPKRSPVDKEASAEAFGRRSQTTKAPNVAAAPMRGGWRL